MKFVKKFFILGLFALFGVSFCSAIQLANWNTISWGTTDKADKYIQMQDGYETCINFGANNALEGLRYDYNGQTNQQFIYSGSSDPYRNLQCFTGNGTITLHKSASSTYILYYWYIPEKTCPTCEVCEEQYTSLECQTEYNLIPVSSVTENYCTSNFDLISPSDCPISSGTGNTQRSALFLNNVQYAGASNIYVNISDLLDYSTTYIDSGSSFVLDVDGYVADTGYLNDILTVQEYHPNSEDFTTAFVSVLTLGLPYIVVALFVLLIRKLIKKIFKS